ncbi:multidrug ABC transporter ATP-binding protein [Clostridia bacterium]|nr:multidrug ABC transporter ATP-binding protein [Clostridia bacterium]
MIKVENLSKKYGGHTALDGISFEAEKGEVLGFLGANGAGKSTTMNIITGYIGSSGGDVYLDGVSVTKEPLKAKKRIGYLPEQPPLYPDMTVFEHLSFVYELKKAGKNKREHLSEIAEKVNITDVGGRLIKNLSKGYKQRVGFAAALVGDPDALILDEPTAGLDPRQIVEIRDLIKTLGKEKTVIFSTHILLEVQAACDKIIIINAGKIVASDTAEGLEKRAGSTVNVASTGDFDSAHKLLKEMYQVKSVEVSARGDVNRFAVAAHDYVDIDVSLPAAIFTAFAKAGLTLVSLNTVRSSLEDIFIDLTKGAA